MNKSWKGRRQQTTRLNIREERARLLRKRDQERKRQIKVGGAELTLKAFIQKIEFICIRNTECLTVGLYDCF